MNVSSIVENHKGTLNFSLLCALFLYTRNTTVEFKILIRHQTSRTVNALHQQHSAVDRMISKNKSVQTIAGALPRKTAYIIVSIFSLFLKMAWIDRVGSECLLSIPNISYWEENTIMRIKGKISYENDEKGLVLSSPVLASYFYLFTPFCLSIPCQRRKDTKPSSIIFIRRYEII